MTRTRAAVAALAVVALLAALARARGAIGRARGSMRTSSAPGAGSYEAIFERLLGGFYDRVAEDAERALAGIEAPSVLEVGPGPGGLALRLAARHPDLHLAGLDIDPAMVERAGRRAAASGTDGRIRFTVGDVASLPFEDGTFDLVVSTFSVHHWKEPEAGFSEIRRVLRPGGRAIVYDLPDRWGRFEGHAMPLASAARAAFPGATVEPVRWPGGIALTRRLEVVRTG